MPSAYSAWEGVLASWLISGKDPGQMGRHRVREKAVVAGVAVGAKGLWGGGWGAVLSCPHPCGKPLPQEVLCPRVPRPPNSRY